ncbi:MAG: hypothetical protein GXO45_02280 [Aquificae bacterium]|nr:hypothetical protein [Aquificota bacterium]
MGILKALVVLVIGLGLFSQFSCSLKGKPSMFCAMNFGKVKALSTAKKDYQVKGGIVLKGIYLKFTGVVGKETKLDFYPPIGRKVLTVKYQGDTICLQAPDKGEVCSEDTDIYMDYLGIKMPFDVRDLLTGRPKIPEDAEYTCEGKFLIVNTKDTRFVYSLDGEPKLKKVVYGDFEAEYIYENGKLKAIEIKANGEKLLKIYIKQIKEVWIS